MILYLLKYYFESKLFSMMPVWMIKKIHIKRFRKIFEFSRENSEFYKKVYSDAGVLDLQIKTEEDIKKIPIVDKQLMNLSKLESVLTCEKSNNLIKRSTSGSTGIPFDTFLSKKEYFTSYVRTFLALHTYNPFKSFVLIGVYKQKEEIEKKSFLYFLQKYFGVFRRETYSVFTPPSEIIEKLKDRKISILSATPSCVKVLVAELQRTKKKLNIGYIVTFGETLFDDIREDISLYFQAKVIDVYGCMEHPSFSWTKPNGRLFYYALNSVYIEYVNPVRINGDLYGELVMTNLVNRTMPFIRYKIGDHVKIHDSQKTMGRIIGRVEDIIELKNGAKLFRLQVWSLFNALSECNQYKIIQKKDKRIIFQASCKYDVDKQILKEKIIRIWHNNFYNTPLEVEFYDDLPINTKTGKFKNIEVED